MFGVLIRSRGMPVGCDSIEPTETFIRRSFTSISTAHAAATTVEISPDELLLWVTIRRSNQLNYAPALKISFLRLPALPLAACPFLKLPENAEHPIYW
jgi:hypothetical protein